MTLFKSTNAPKNNAGHAPTIPTRGKEKLAQAMFSPAAKKPSTDKQHTPSEAERIATRLGMK